MTCGMFDCSHGCRVEQERVAQELAGLQERLEAREASLQQLQTTSGGVLALKANYDRVVGELAAERDTLQRERLQLMQVLPLTLRPAVATSRPVHNQHEPCSCQMSFCRSSRCRAFQQLSMHAVCVHAWSRCIAVQP